MCSQYTVQERLKSLAGVPPPLKRRGLPASLSVNYVLVLRAAFLVSERFELDSIVTTEEAHAISAIER